MQTPRPRQIRGFLRGTREIGILSLELGDAAVSVHAAPI
jgi:hypothetical protein